MNYVRSSIKFTWYIHAYMFDYLNRRINLETRILPLCKCVNDDTMHYTHISTIIDNNDD